MFRKYLEIFGELFSRISQRIFRPNLGIASSPVNSSACLVGTVGGAVTFVWIASFAVRHLEKEALSNQARSDRIEEGAWGRG